MCHEYTRMGVHCPELTWGNTLPKYGSNAPISAVCTCDTLVPCCPHQLKAPGRIFDNLNDVLVEKTVFPLVLHLLELGVCSKKHQLPSAFRSPCDMLSTWCRFR